MKNNIPCEQCQHSKKYHKLEEGKYGFCWYGWPKGNTVPMNPHRCYCEEYFPDNLGYLEQIYEKSRK